MRNDMDVTFEDLVEAGIREPIADRNTGKCADLRRFCNTALGGWVKTAAQPYWQRALKAQTYQPSWSPKLPWYKNILANIRQTYLRGQRMVTADDMLRDWRSSASPNLRFQRVWQYLRGGDQVVTNPLDRLLYRRPIRW